MSVRKILNKAEKFCIIVVPIVYILADVLSGFIPALASLTDEKGYLVVLSGLMVLIFIHTEKNNRDGADILRSERIVKDMVTLLEKKHEYADVQIFAVTGYQYYTAFAESGVKVKNMRILLRKADDISTICLPSKAEDKPEFLKSSKGMVRDWNALCSKGQIENLEIYYYDFDTVFHFMILDNKFLFYGLLFPKKTFPGTDVLNSYIVSHQFDVGEDMISDFKKEWDRIREFTKE